MHIDILYYSSYFILIYKVPHILKIWIARYLVLWRLLMQLLLSMIIFRISLCIMFFYASNSFHNDIIIVRGRHHRTNLGNFLGAIFRCLNVFNRLLSCFHLNGIVFIKTTLLLLCFTFNKEVLSWRAWT